MRTGLPKCCDSHEPCHLVRCDNPSPMLEPFAPCHWRWSPTALVLLAVTACGGRTSGTVVSASGAEMSSGTLEPEGGADTSVPDASATVDATPGQDSSADAGTPPSCAPGGPGMSDCGAASESCCTSLEVTGGTYYRTYSWDPNVGPAGEADPATVSSFRLDKYLVTVGRFRQFVNAWNGGAGYTPPAGSGKHVHLNGGLGLVNVGDDAGLAYEPGWVATDDVNVAPTSTNLNCIGANDYPTATWTPSASTQENLPINCVNWYEAYAFCIWDDGFLPSEAEWEYAAAGGNQEREFPWGSTAPGRPTSMPSTTATIRAARRGVARGLRTSRLWGRRRWAPGSGASSTWRVTAASGRWTGTRAISILVPIVPI
jgi:formylglycine-generating enzyme required for sulfatase activity